MKQAHGSGPDITGGASLGVINQAITAVPAVKYALGIVGVAAAAALITTYFKSGITAAIVGTALLLVAMILLFVFSRLASLPGDNRSLQYLAVILAWFFVLMFCGFGALTASCVFFDKPKPYPILVRTLVSPLSSVELKPATQVVTVSANTSGSPNLRLTQLTKISSLPDPMKSGISNKLTADELQKDLQGLGELTIDGTTLVVGEIGDGITSSLSVDVLHLINGGRIVTNGNSLKIQANRIEVSSGGLNAFYPPTLAPADAPPGVPGTRGANGGNIYISSAKGIDGVLKVDLSGENGGRGGVGAAGAAGAAGARGQNGVDGFLNCSSGGSDGSPGGPGKDGGPGAPGGDGGDAGHLYLSRNLKGSTVELIAEGGNPGPGGLGGPGGPGGPGGQGGSGSVHCGGGHGGANGVNGLGGGSGPSGKPGNRVTAIEFF